MNRRRILIVDDDPHIVNPLRTILSEGYDLEFVTNAPDALKFLYKNAVVSAAIVDIGLPDGISGIELLSRLRMQYPDMPVVMLTGKEDYRFAPDSMKKGAADFVKKGTVGFEEELTARLGEAISRFEMIADGRVWKNKAVESQNQYQIIGQSPSILELRELLKEVRKPHVGIRSFLVTGEPGVGKERVARELSDFGDGRPRAFIEVNCSALSPELLESELFGHEKGSFTHAISKREGKFRAANGGTLFLDEIGDMPKAMQAKLLRALETMTVVPVGSETPIPFKARIVCATNRDIAQDVATGHFREDLYHRIAGWRIHVPPLRERREDIPLLVDYFIDADKFGPTKVSTSAIEKLLSYDWPGNIRELKHCLDRARVRAQMRQAGTIEPDMLEFDNVRRHGEVSDSQSPFIPKIDEDISAATLSLHLRWAEEIFLRRSFYLVDANKTKLASKLGRSRFHLHEKLISFGIASRDQ